MRSATRGASRGTRAGSRAVGRSAGLLGRRRLGGPTVSPAPPSPTPPASNGLVGALRGLLQGAFGATASVLGAAEAAAAVALGERDADRLTDILFHARHRERGGRPIAPGEAQPAQEWRRLRDDVVVPALRQIPPPAGSTASLRGASPASAFTRSSPSARRWTLLVP